jgi:hypothetical protein
VDAAEQLAAADGWMGEGLDLARRLLAYAEQLRMEALDSATKTEVADDLDSILRKEFDPRVQPR